MLKPGAPAPDFTVAASDGRTLRLSDFRGKRLVLYFYPKAFTPGCTAQTRRFRDNYAELQALGAEVVGVSVDTEARQCDFAQAERVRFPLVADADRTLSRDYDVLWPVLSIDRRVTYVIDPAGVVEAVFHHEVQVSKHLDDVLDHLQARAAVA